ncbi:MAG: glutamate racemase [Psychromonas sp.]|jgi:glutamate racemase
MNNELGPIGVFDSGYGGLTVLKELEKSLPEYDYLYLGDNARTPYGTRSFEVVYQFTLQAVEYLFSQGCHLVILACNTASAKALRSIQMNDLVNLDPSKRVLGVIRPSTEKIGELSSSKHVGIMATPGTVNSGSYSIELKKFYPDLVVTEYACPMWVPLIENNEHLSTAGREFIKADLDKVLKKDPNIDLIVLACTHYPLVKDYLISIAPKSVNIIGQGEIVGKSLKEYLLRHEELEKKCNKSQKITFLTTETKVSFEEKATVFYGKEVVAKQIHIRDF